MKKKRIQVSFTIEQYQLIRKLSGELGNSDSEIIRNIVIAWLSEKSFLSTYTKNRIFKDEN